MNIRPQTKNEYRCNSTLFWARHHIEMVKDSMLRILSIVNHFDVIVEPDDQNNGGIYLGAQPVKWGGYCISNIQSKVKEKNQVQRLIYFSILENEEIHNGPYIDSCLRKNNIEIIDIKKNHNHYTPSHKEVLSEPKGLHSNDELPTKKESNFYQLELKDYQAFSENDHANILETIKKMHKARQKGSIYIHCKSGMGRSMSILLCYLTLYVFQGDIERAYDHIKEKRWVISAKDSDHYKAAEHFCKKHPREKIQIDDQTDYHTLYDIKLAGIVKLARSHLIPIKYTPRNNKNDKNSKSKYENLISRVRSVKNDINEEVTDHILRSRQSFCPTFFNSQSKNYDNKVKFFNGLTNLFPKLYDESDDNIKVVNLLEERSNPDLLIASLEKYIHQLEGEIKAQQDSLFGFTGYKKNKITAAEKMISNLANLNNKSKISNPGRTNIEFTREDILCLADGRLGDIIKFHYQSLPKTYVFSKHHYSSMGIAMNLLIR